MLTCTPRAFALCWTRRDVKSVRWPKDTPASERHGMSRRIRLSGTSMPHEQRGGGEKLHGTPACRVHVPSAAQVCNAHTAQARPRRFRCVSNSPCRPPLEQPRPDPFRSPRHRWCPVLLISVAGPMIDRSGSARPADSIAGERPSVLWSRSSSSRLRRLSRCGFGQMEANPCVWASCGECREHLERDTHTKRPLNKVDIDCRVGKVALRADVWVPNERMTRCRGQMQVECSSQGSLHVLEPMSRDISQQAPS